MIKYINITEDEGLARSHSYKAGSYYEAIGKRFLGKKIKRWLDENPVEEIVSIEFYGGSAIKEEGVHIFYKEPDHDA